MPAEMPSSSLLAIGRYALAWTAAVALAALGAVSLLRAADDPRAVAAEPLELTAERGDCVLRRAGIYTRAPRTAAVVASLRRGMIVVHYRRGTPQGMVLALRRERVQSASIVAPGASGMRYALAATAWGRLLGCPRITPGALAAVRAFAATYQGRGPEAGR
jgi:hypothetical protein